jgi:hypothetical protein
VINRVNKRLVCSLREIDLQGLVPNKRHGDYDQPISENLAFRVNGLIESSDSFRDHVDRERTGIAPAFTYLHGDATKITVGYEHFRDERVADRGITSFRGRPADVDRSTFYGNPDDSHVEATVDLASAALEHRFGGLTLRNRTLYGTYDRFYQNYVPGAVTADKAQVTLTAYNNATQRDNLFNQTDLTWGATTGSVRHTFLGGVELGRQLTDNFRNTGFFNNTATSILVPYASPQTTTPVTYRQSATDADNHLRTEVSAVYAQDQIEPPRSSNCWRGSASTASTSSTQQSRRRPEPVDNPSRRVPGSSSPVASSRSTPATASRTAEPGRPVLLSDHHHAAGRARVFRNLEVGASGTAGRLLAHHLRLPADAPTLATDPNDPTRSCRPAASGRMASRSASTGRSRRP